MTTDDSFENFWQARGFLGGLQRSCYPRSLGGGNYRLSFIRCKL